MARLDELEERVADLERILDPKQGRVPLGSLPVKGLNERMKELMVPEGDQFMLPHSVGIDSLAEVPHARVYSTAAQAIPALTHTALTHNTVHFKSEGNSIQVDLANFPTRITFTEGGLYLVYASVIFDGTTNVLSKLTILYNAAGAYAAPNEYDSQEMSASAAGNVPGLQAVSLHRVAPGEHVESYGLHGAAVNTYIDAAGGQRSQVLGAVRLSL